MTYKQDLSGALLQEYSKYSPKGSSTPTSVCPPPFQFDPYNLQCTITVKERKYTGVSNPNCPPHFTFVPAASGGGSAGTCTLSYRPSVMTKALQSPSFQQKHVIPKDTLQGLLTHGKGVSSSIIKTPPVSSTTTTTGTVARDPTKATLHNVLYVHQ